MRRQITRIATLLAVSLLSVAPISAQDMRPWQTSPLIPFNTNFWNYWDHHWLMWLPEHPVYEAIELSSYDNPEDPDYKLIRVFLTEREGNKTQYFYLNDKEAVRRSRANAYYRDIRYRTEGKFGEPLDLYVEFRDKDDQLVQWSVHFEPGQQLRQREGLTPSIHSVGSILLFLLRDQTVDTPHGTFAMGGTDYSFKGDPKTTEVRYRSWYNHNVYSAVIVFGSSRFDYGEGRISNSWDREFQQLPGDGNVYVSNPLGYENEIRFETNDQGEIRTYSNISFGHSFRFDFDPALPTIASARSGQRIGYSVSFDEFKHLVRGEITVKREMNTLLLNWQHAEPDWARERPFESLIIPDGEGYDLRVNENR